MTPDEAAQFVRNLMADYEFLPAAIFKLDGSLEWPLTVDSPEDLHAVLREGDHLLPLPNEPAALANVIETSVLEFVGSDLAKRDDVNFTRGTERGYPDFELSGDLFGGDFLAVDIKVARRSASGVKTKSRITLYTGNTYFLYPQLKWPALIRKFSDYFAHVDVIVLYDFEPETHHKVENVEVVVHETWRLGSKERSSTTREYIGAVNDIDSLRKGEGEFETEESFYKFWRAYPFKIGRAVQNQLKKLLDQ